MAKHEVELNIKGTYFSMIECNDGSLYEEDCPEFTNTKLPGTENFNTEALTTFVQKNIKAIWDGQLDNPEHFSSYEVKKIDGPSGAFYEDGMNLRSIAVIIEIETEENVEIRQMSSDSAQSQSAAETWTTVLMQRQGEH